MFGNVLGTYYRPRCIYISRFVCSVSERGACRGMHSDPFAGLVWSQQILGDLGRSGQFFYLYMKEMLFANIDPQRAFQINNRTNIAQISTKNGTNLAQGNGKGTNKSTNIWNKRKNEKYPNEETCVVFQYAAFFSKVGGLDGWAFTDVLCKQVIKTVV